MSIWSLASSLLMIAVLRVSLICCRSSVRPGVKVLTFHVPNLSVGGLHLCLFLINLDLPGAELSNRLSGALHKPHAPSEAGGPWRGSTLVAEDCSA